MSYATWKILHRKFLDDNKWSNTINDISNFYDPLIVVNIGTGKDSFEYKINNFNNNYTYTFSPNDKISVYRVLNNLIVNTNSDLLMECTVNNVPETINNNNHLIRVSTYNFSESLMGALTFIDATNLTISEAIQQALLQVASQNENFKVTWHPDNLNGTNLNSKGQSFPYVLERFYNKPIKELLEKYSRNEKTLDGHYMWYVDNNNRLVWKKRLDTINHTFNSSTSLYKSLNIKKDINEVKNYIIVKGGRDPAGNPIQTVYADYTSISKHGMKYYVLTDITVNAQALIKADMDKAGVTTGTYPDSYPFTTTWKSKNTGNYVTVDNASEYNEAVRSHIKIVCKEEGRLFAELRKYGKLKVEISFGLGDVTWGLGEVISCIIPSVNGSVPKLLRVQEIQYSNTGDTYYLEEDIGSL